jgi:probable rRNA maturation factor
LWEENGEFRPDKSWDVLALGDVVVAPDVVRRNAEEEKISYNYEMARVIIHGALHLAGFGHETEARAEEMFGLQEKILERYAARANIQGGLTAE